jgi:hypothetical protein
MVRFNKYGICTLSYISRNNPAPPFMGLYIEPRPAPQDHRVRLNAAHRRKETPA